MVVDCPGGNSGICAGKEFIENGADLVTFHIEATKDEEEVLSLIDYIHSKGVKVGISIKPKTSPETVIKYLDKKGHKFDHYIDIKELLKAIYRDVENK